MATPRWQVPQRSLVTSAAGLPVISGSLAVISRDMRIILRATVFCGLASDAKSNCGAWPTWQYVHCTPSACANPCIVAMSSGRAMSFGYSCRLVSGGGAGCCAVAGGVCARTADAISAAVPKATKPGANRLMITPVFITMGGGRASRQLPLPFVDDPREQRNRARRG